MPYEFTIRNHCIFRHTSVVIIGSMSANCVRNVYGQFAHDVGTTKRKINQLRKVVVLSSLRGRVHGPLGGVPVVMHGHCQ